MASVRRNKQVNPGELAGVGVALRARLVGIGGTSLLSEPPQSCTQIRCPMCLVWRGTSHIQKEIL